MTNPSLQRNLFDVVLEDTQKLDQLIHEQLDSDVVLIKQVASYIIQSGGKRLRPKVLLLVARALGYEGNKHIILATIIEFIHVATLLHDDVVDSSQMRRGKPSANIEFSNSAAVLVGDFLYSRAFQLMTKIDDVEVFKILSDTTNKISEGEVMQLMRIGDSELDEQGYYDIVERKTACLFEAACWLGAMIAGGSDEQTKYSRQYGHSLGMAFQIVDDMLDYVANEEETGKSLGDDLREGKITLPLVLLLQQGSDKEKKIVTDAITTPSDAYLLQVIEIIKSKKITQQIQHKVKEITSKALFSCENMPNNVYSEALKEIAIQAMGRTS
jgi:octaprenyl-diphosphate synthase